MYRDCGCIRAMNPDMDLSSSHGPQQQPGPGNTMALGGNKATHISPLLTSFSSSDVPLPTGHEPLSLSVPYHTIHLFNIIVLICPAPQSAECPRVFSSEPEAEGPRAAGESPCPAQPGMALGRIMLLHYKDIITVLSSAGSWLVQRCCWSPLVGWA